MCRFVLGHEGYVKLWRPCHCAFMLLFILRFFLCETNSNVNHCCGLMAVLSAGRSHKNELSWHHVQLMFYKNLEPSREIIWLDKKWMHHLLGYNISKVILLFKGENWTKMWPELVPGFVSVATGLQIGSNVALNLGTGYIKILFSCKKKYIYLNKNIKYLHLVCRRVAIVCDMIYAQFFFFF